VPTSDTLFSISANNITINNLQFIGANLEAIAKDFTTNSFRNTTIKNCNINFSGRNAINFRQWDNRNTRVEDNVISNTNNNAINLGVGCLNSNANRNIVVNSGNLIGMGPNLGDYSGVQVSGRGSIASFNTIINAGYNALTINGDSSKCFNNIIDTFSFVKDDGAGIYMYTGGANTEFIQREIRDNIVGNGIGVILGVGSNPKPFAEGIYLDDNVAGVAVNRNTVYNIAKSGILIHNARNSSVLNNLVFNCGFGIEFSDDALGGPISGMVVKNNQFISRLTTQYAASFFSQQNNYTTFGNLDSNVYSRPILDSATIKMEFPNMGWGFRTLDHWKSYSGLDAASIKATTSISNVNQFDFQVNTTNIPLNYSFMGMSKITVSGAISNNSFIIPSYSGILFLPNGVAQSLHILRTTHRFKNILP
jgi:parallel beta-helix repeat protein